ncbi:MAG: aminopeptidase, partial [Lachnospiraceae bacterium]|nr:aminopeptidase [Lachnospiraceae bacterium]
MTFEEKQADYARLIVKAGAAVREGQRVFLSCPIEAYEFGRMVVKEAYLAGAEAVVVKWQDDVTTRMTYEYAPLSVFSEFPEWQALEMNTYAREDYAFIYLSGSDPEAFKGVDIRKMQAAMEAAQEPMKEYRKAQSTMAVKWTVLAIPSRGWAAKVFPGMNVDTAVTRLWDAIFATVRIGSGDPYEKWMAHADNLAEKCRILNEWQLDSLHYENSLGTDFTVGLVENHRWEGGADIDKKNGARFFANMPTEEVFTMPDCRRAEGTLVSAMPLSFRGSLIENFRLTFKDGEVTDFDAEKGKESLKALLESDPGSKRLGECALVPYPSPVAEQGILFLKTLFDENA